MFCESSPFECHCQCHHSAPGTVKHIMTCCTECPHCGARITFGVSDHIAKCKAREEEMRRLAHIALDLKEVG